MNKLAELSFTELESLRQYYHSVLSDEGKIERLGSKEKVIGHLDLIAQTIEEKFEELTIAKPEVSGGTARASRPSGTPPRLP